ncbi:MAG TPA: choice-of-anchor Q domain-containing protein, partial [Anaerolineales bacterium]|nr:choice-of-anchor Q domain-containing protein [Anaerolineales bacterium]
NTGLDSETARSYGGALYNDGDIELRNVTLSGNAATIGGGIYNDPDGILTISASILVDSPIGRNCVNDGEFNSGGYNLEDTAWCPLDHSGDLYNVDPQLMALDYNGGLTLSFALPPGSPATDVAPGDVCAFADQRNILRPVDSNQDGISRCDAGAYEGAPGGIIRLEPLSATVDETEQEVTVSFSRSGGSGPVGVAYDVAGGTAADTVDFALTPGVLSWAQGDESAQTFTVQVLDDLYKESDEYALIGLLDPTGGAGIERPGHMFTLIIQANDPNGIGGGSPVFMPVIRKR